MSTKTKRTLCGVGAIVMVLALAIGGTFAYTQFEHKSNALKSDANYQARLVEEFEKDPEWIVDKDIKKEISIKNMGGTEQFPGKNWGDIYVRVQLKEHMDITPTNYTYYPENDDVNNTRFMVDKNGDFVRFAATDDIEDMLTLIKSDVAWAKVITDPTKRADYTNILNAADFVKIKGYYDTQEYWYVVTKEGDPNGQYGAFVVMDKIANAAKSVSITGSTRADNVDYSGGMVNYNPGDHETGECFYPVHNWDADEFEKCSMGTHKYVDWNLGSSVILLSEWDGQPIDKWILDPATGWATWGNALKPGQSTADLLESITPIAQPDGEMFYVIHAEMEATDLTEMGDDWIIRGCFEQKSKLKFEEKKINKNIGDPDFQSPTIPGLSNEDYELINWDSSNNNIATVDNTGRVTIEGEGKTIITVTVKPKDGSPSYDISYELVVSDDTPPTTSLDLKTGPFFPEGDDSTPTATHNNFRVYGRFIYGTEVSLTDKFGNEIENAHFGGIKLADIFNGSYEGVEIDYDLMDSRFNPSNLYIGKVHGVDCIVWAYAPTYQECYDSAIADPLELGRVILDATIYLKIGELKGSVDVSMIYSENGFYANP